MAKNPNFTRSLVDKFNIKGVLSEDGTIITYINDDKEEAEISVLNCFDNFKNECIELTIAVKNSMELPVTIDDGDNVREEN